MPTTSSTVQLKQSTTLNPVVCSERATKTHRNSTVHPVLALRTSLDPAHRSESLCPRPVTCSSTSCPST